MRGLLHELKRRNVFRVAIAYVMLAWIVAQVGELALDSFASPAWVMKTLLLMLTLGFPFALLFAWAFELTPEGLKWERDVDREKSITGHTGRRLDRSIIVLLSVALIFVVLDRYVFDSRVEETRVPVASSVSIAVLPFVNMSDDASQEFFSDGISEELLNLLAKIPQFRVAGRTSSFSFKGQNLDLRQIGSALGVETILEGSVRQSGGRVRITAQLIDVDDGFHLWSETYDRELNDIFAVQDDIAAKVVDALEIELFGDAQLASAPQSRINNVDAHNAYLQGLFFYNKSGTDNLRSAVDHLQRAVELAPESALVWAAYARALDAYASQSDTDVSQLQGFAREAVTTALELGPDLPEAHLAQAELLYNLDWDWTGARAALDRALELRPGYLDAQTLHVNLLMTHGDLNEAERVLREVVAKDPLDDRLPRALLYLLIFDNRPDEAIVLGESLLQRDPNNPFTHTWLAYAHYLQGRPDTALRYAEKEPVTFARYVGLAIAHHALGNTDEARSARAELEESYGDLAAYQQAIIYSIWGDTDKALDWVETAYRAHDSGLLNIKIDAAFTSLRGQPRFEAILHGMNLAD